MLTLNIEIGDFVFRDIKKNELDLVLELYNDDDESMFATGTSRCLSLEDMEEKYLEVLISSHEFFIGIFLKTSDKLIGVLKGRIDYEHNEEAWITSFIIKKEHRNMGIGNKTINAFISYMHKTYDVKSFSAGVISKNKNGIDFWIKAGFKHVRTIKNYINLNNAYEDFIIMRREIQSSK
jgi:RimJ/RimL family protein N-acetyltransferase